MRKLACLVFAALLFPACGEDDEPSAFTQCTKACPGVCGDIWSCGPDGTCTCGDRFDQVDDRDQVDNRDAAPDFEPDEIEPDETEPDEVAETEVIAAQYRFVRIDDVTLAPVGENKGADLDAVILTKSSGIQFFANNVESYSIGTGDPIMIDAMEIVGPPDAFVGWSNGDLSQCDGNAGWVALGQGGSIVVRMGGEIEAGDNLTVLELSRCALLSGVGTASDDEIEVFVSVSAEPAGTWELVGGGVGPEISMTIPSLP